jgi:hypothetical protein
MTLLGDAIQNVYNFNQTPNPEDKNRVSEMIMIESKLGNRYYEGSNFINILTLKTWLVNEGFTVVQNNDKLHISGW